MTISTNQDKKITHRMLKAAQEVADEYGCDVSESQIRTVLDVGLPYKNMEDVIAAAEAAGIDAWIADLMIDSAVTKATKPEQSEYP
ncbi:hypothetical protein ABHF54_14010 (plasmid) [Nitrosomonas europaea]|uniref:hypothetical protein n=1 Tax=Nitrosomonas europaea TaxID=915 RepID=UPI003264F1DB